MSSSSVQRQAAIIWAANSLIQRWEDFLQYISADRRSPCGLWIVHVAIMQMRREEWDQRWTAEKGWMVMDCLMWDDGGLGRVRWKWQEISLKPSRVGPKENWVVIIMRNATCTADAVIGFDKLDVQKWYNPNLRTKGNRNDGALHTVHQLMGLHQYPSFSSLGSLFTLCFFGLNLDEDINKYYYNIRL